MARSGRPTRLTDPEQSPEHALARALQDARLASGQSQKTVAAKLGLVRQRIGDVEQATRPITSEEEARRWAEATNADWTKIRELYADTEAGRRTTTEPPASAPEDSLAPVPGTERQEPTRVWGLGRQRAWALTLIAGIVITAAVTILAVGGNILASGPSCDEVGYQAPSQDQPAKLDPRHGEPFRTAWRQWGGRTAIGCPLPVRHGDGSGWVHGWGQGVSQDLEGGRLGPARIMRYDRYGVVVLSGQLNHDYTAIDGQDTAPLDGYPTSNPVPCGTTSIVELRGGSRGTAEMVLAEDRTHWIYLPTDFWARYIELGGPIGRLGAPKAQVAPLATGLRLVLQHGELIEHVGSNRVVTDLEDRRLAEPGAPPPSCTNTK